MEFDEEYLVDFTSAVHHNVILRRGTANRLQFQIFNLTNCLDCLVCELRSSKRRWLINNNFVIQKFEFIFKMPSAGHQRVVDDLKCAFHEFA